MNNKQTASECPIFFTIVSANYMAYAKTLMISIRNFYPDAIRYVFLADETTQDFEIERGLFKLCFAKDLKVPNFRHLAFRYSILEFNTALKPFAISQLMREHDASPIIYIDPDIIFLSPLYEVFSLLKAGATAVLTPHLTNSLEDGKYPDELAISRVGSFNLGFIATGANHSRKDFIDWWCRKLEYGAYVNLEEGLFTDQKWIDLVPGMFPDISILRHPGYNLAYWNLPHRLISISDSGVLTANGERVSFIHFSGVDTENPEIFSKHQNRFNITNIGALRPTYEQYIDFLKINGHEKFKVISYYYGKLTDGVRITDEMRAIFRVKFDIGCSHEASDPFAISAEAFHQPLSLLTRLFRWMRKQYPRIQKLQIVRILLNKLTPHTRRQLRKFILRSTQFPAIAVRRQADSQVAIGFASNLEEGRKGPAANFIGYLKGEFGVAENARLFIAAAQIAGVDLALTNIDSSSTGRQNDFRFESSIVNVANFPINVIFANADQTPYVKTVLGPNYGSKYTIGYWFWELGSFPLEWSSSFNEVNEIWVATDFVKEAVQKRTNKPVFKLRTPIQIKMGRTYHRSEFLLPDDKFVFLFSFDFNSFIDRKNPLGVIQAFKIAFPNFDDRAILLIKSTNGNKKLEDYKRISDAISRDVRIILHDEFLSREAMFGLESVVDSYISLHRAEGLGLGLAESMALGKPVIGTAYSGNMEFMDASNSCLVGYNLIDIEPHQYPYAHGNQWAEPDLQQAGFHMRRLVDDQQYASDLGKAAASHMRRVFSLERCGVSVSNRLSEVQQHVFAS